MEVKTNDGFKTIFFYHIKQIMGTVKRLRKEGTNNMFKENFL